MTRALEVGGGRGIAMAGALLRSVGWDVIKVEPPGGDPLRRRAPLDGDGEGLLFAALNRGKRSVSCDVGTGDGRRAVTELSRDATVVLAAGAEAEALGALHSRVLVRVDDFGPGGPYDGWRMSDLTWAALTGLAHATPPGPIRPDELHEPLKPGPELHELTTGLGAAAAALVLTLDRSPGDGCREVRLNHHELAVTLPILENVYSFLALGETVARGSDRMRYAPLALMRCADGWMYVQCHDETTWRRFVEVMGEPEWAADVRFADRFARYDHWNELEPRLLEWLGSHAKAEIFERCKAHGVPFAPVHDMGDLERSEHIRGRGLITTIIGSGGRSLRAPDLPTRVAGVGADAGPERVPRAGEHTGALLGRPARRDATPPPHRGDAWAGALDGLRVLDFSIIWAGPWVTRLLASAGATVVRVESRVRPELLRVVPPYVPGLPELESGLEHQVQNRAKRSLALNLKHPLAAGLARRLAAASDVVVQNFRPGVADRLGIGFAALREANPELVMLSISGYGATGPDAGAGAAGSGVLAYSGSTALTGYTPDRPHTLGTSWPDQASGLTGAFCILSVLHRRRLGLPSDAVHIDLALNDVMLALLAEPLMAHLNGAPAPDTYGNRTPASLLSGCYPALGDDEWLAVTVEEPDELEALAGLLREQGATGTGLEDRLRAWSADRSAHDAAGTLQARGVAAAPVLDGRGVVEDAQLAARGFWERVDHPAGVALRLPRHAVVEGPTASAPAAAVLGADTEAICRDWLGMADDELAHLTAEGVLH